MKQWRVRETKRGTERGGERQIMCVGGTLWTRCQLAALIAKAARCAYAAYDKRETDQRDREGKREGDK